MSRLRAILLASLLIAAAAPLASPASAFTSGVWEGNPSFDEAGKLTDCTMTAQSDSGILLAFIISRDFDWGLVLYDDKWTLRVGSTTDVELRVDALPPMFSTGKIVDAHGILVPLENTDPVVEAMRHGEVLIVATELGKFSFRLTGTADGIVDLAGCVTEHLEAEKVMGGATVPPIETKAPADGPDDENRLFTEEEALTFVSELLASAGITNYELIDPDENPMPNFDVVWTYANGIVAALVGYKGMSAVDLDEATGVVIADDAKNCEGDFFSGKKVSEPAETVSVKRVFTTCRTDGKTVEIHYTLVKTESGHLIQIAHLNLGEATGDVATADRAFLRTAVLQNFK
ncbi:MAG: hypothetical protein WBD76_11930 [Methyloceanibacter sp.]|jgi:hypothetical protein